MLDEDSERADSGAEARKVLAGFYRQFLEDIEKGAVRPLAEYQRLFPGHDALIAEEVEHLEEHRAALLGGLEATLPLNERLRRRFGEGVDPEVSLDAPDAPSGEKPSSTLLAKLSAHAPKEPRYRFVGEIARGGMGAILRVFDEDLRRTLAMKVALGKGDPETRGETPPVDAQTLARFLEEAQVTGQLDHPGIVPVHELGLDSQGRVFFTMRLVRGRDLKEIFDLVKEGKEGWTQTRALGVLLRVCEAMAYAHSKGVVHRDLKPGNVMVGRFGEVYVMDWGLSRVIGRKDTKDLRLRPVSASTSTLATERTRERELDPLTPLVTMDGTVVGTPSYMSPEQARGEIEKIDRRSDVYSIGAMLYQLLAGHMPYVPPGMTPSGHAVWKWVLEGPPAPLRKRNPHVPPELESICEKTMARDQARRYPDTMALAEDLRAYLEGRVVRAHKTGPVVQVRKWVKRNRPLAASVAASIVILIVAGAWRLHQVRTEENRFQGLLTEAKAAGEAGDLERAIALTDQALALRADHPFASERRGTYVSERDRLQVERERLIKTEEQKRQHERLIYNARARVAKGLGLLVQDREVTLGLQGPGETLPQKRRRLREMEAAIKGPEGPDVKRPVWALEEEIRQEEKAIMACEKGAELEFLQAIAMAGAEIPEAKAALADLWFARYERAVEAGEETEADNLARSVRFFDEARRHSDRLDANGTLALRTEPSGARAYLFRYVEKEKRLWPAPFHLAKREALPFPGPESPASVPASGYVAPSAYEDLVFEPANDVGVTPIEDLSLPHGSYLLVLRKEGFVDVRYPVLIRRGRGEEPRNPVRLWKTEKHPDPEKWVYVPEGLSVVGGDREAFWCGDRREIYLPAFFIGRFEVTIKDYLEFLNAPETIRGFLQARQKGALPYVPREGESSGPRWKIPENEADRFEMAGDLWSLPDGPVLQVTWEDSQHYVTWLNRRGEEAGDPWEYALPTEHEWERAARGADGRFFPWGNGFDWTFCRGARTRGGIGGPEQVGRFWADQSPFGVFDMAGNVWEFCRNPPDQGSFDERGYRGGSWNYSADRLFRSASRGWYDPGMAVPIGAGIRLVCRGRVSK